MKFIITYKLRITSINVIDFNWFNMTMYNGYATADHTYGSEFITLSQNLKKIIII